MLILDVFMWFLSFPLSSVLFLSLAHFQTLFHLELHVNNIQCPLKISEAYPFLHLSCLTARLLV